MRYVDDIVLMAKSEKSARNGIIQLDIASRELALIPQGAKTFVRKIENIEDELKGENSIISDLVNSEIKKEDIERQSRLKKLFLTSFKVASDDGDGYLQILEETDLKFSLNRLLPDPEISPLVLKIAFCFPHLTKFCVAYLNQEKLSEELSKQVLDNISSEPIHDWQSSQMLQLAPNMHSEQRTDLVNIASQLLSKSHKHWILRFQCAFLLSEFSEFNDIIHVFLEELENLIYENNTRQEQAPLMMALFKYSMKLDSEQTIHFLNHAINKKGLVPPDEICMFLSYYSDFKRVDLPNEIKLLPWVNSNLPIEYQSSSVDGISHRLVEFYELPTVLKLKVDFRDYFQNQEEYKTALESLSKACGFFERNPEDYINYTDSFNQLLLAEFYSRHPDERNIAREEMGNMVGALKNTLPNVYLGFEKCHRTRSEIPKIHAYNKEHRILNPHSSSLFTKRDMIKREISISYQYLIEYIINSYLMRIPSIDATLLI